MLGSAPLEAVLGAGVDNRDHAAVKAFIRSAAGLGLSVLFCHPGTKIPTDMRTSRQRNADDRAAQEAAQQAGRADWGKAKSAAGLALATNDKAVLERYLKQYIQTYSTWVTITRTDDGGEIIGEAVPWTKKAEDAGSIRMSEPAAVNIAVEVGGSAIVVVDCDTAAQMEKWFRINGLDDPAHWPAPTITTPGQMGAGADPDDRSTWAHADGGHFWFTVPDKYLPVLPRHIGSTTIGDDTDGFAVLWDRRYVLTPPSTRPEGAYEQLGHVYELPDWLADEIIKAGKRRTARADLLANGAVQTEQPDLADAVDAWSESVTWAQILEPLGWCPAPRSDSCGCPVWTAPGVHSSPKSATAHDSGCTDGRYTQRNAPLYIWTDHDVEPFGEWLEQRGTRTISKLQAVSVIDYGGNQGKAMDALRLTPDLSADDPELDKRGTDADLDHGGDGEFSMPDPGAGAHDYSEGPPVDIGGAGSYADPVGWCEPCKSAEGLFATDPDDGTLWHAKDAADAAETGGHLADGTDQTAVLTPGFNDDQVEAIFDEFTRTLDAGDPFPGEASAPPPAGDSPYPDAVDDPEPDVFDSAQTGVPRMAPFSYWRNVPPPDYIVDGLIEHGGLSCVIGAPGVGKSTVVLDMLAHIANGKSWQGRRTLKTRVVYFPGEGLSGVVSRLNTWVEEHGLELDDFILADDVIQVSAKNEAWGEVAAYMARQGIGFAVFDTFARMTRGVDENSATDVGRAVARFGALRKLTNAGVCVVHHTGKGSPNVARGSSALNGAIDSELLVRTATWDVTQIADDNGRIDGKPIEVWTSKQKNAEQLDTAIPLLLSSRTLPGTDRTAAFITGPTGEVDPMQAEIFLSRPIPEPIVETAIRIRRYLDNLPKQGATRTDLVLAIRPDAYARSRADAGAYWKQRIAEAVDRALRYELVETLSGTPSGARYVPYLTTPEQARGMAAAEVVDNDD